MVMMPRPRSLSPDEIVSRASRIRLVLTDVDGVLTDAGVYYGDSGEVMKRFSVRDGMGVERLKNAGIQTGFVTKERSRSVERRAEKLGLAHVYLGVVDKRKEIESLTLRTEFRRPEVAYLGDDVNDIEALKWVGQEGLTGAPSDAVPEVLALVHHASVAAGGHGAFRAFAEWLLLHRKRSTPNA